MLSHAFIASLLAISANAHVGTWNPGMYCKGGNNTNEDNQNTNLIVNPLYQLEKDVWWQQRDRGCHLAPPPDGEFLELPAGASFTTELANNRAFTTLSYGGQYVSDWQDGQNRTEPWVGPGSPPGCLVDNPDKAGGELHARSREHAAGTAWAISYESDLDKVTMDNLVVFSVRYHTPWKRLTSYDVPADLPECPPEGCYCAWLWIPDGCGQPNMYMSNHRCKVTGSKSTKTLGTPKAPVWCEDDQSKCLSGPKQMMAWNQASGDNVVAPQGRTPTYNERMGFKDGAQDDIFVESENQPSSSLSSTQAAAAQTSSTQASTQSTAPATTTSIQSTSSESSTAAATTSTPSAQPSQGESTCSKQKRHLRHHARHMA
ncbi:unnamed protein product [Clonostachys chloroleuca]|uniref:Proteophosphoglycan ppg4 n=1 Tax=Clonostachys chloroleuca TaxID=1926264 RepID=A0AA35MIH0_9HYPO|nr:unnamed protein product [Clonostachys chloroleuca]